MRPELEPATDHWSPAESWLGGKLARTGMRWTRRVPRHFQQYERGILLRLVGPDHRPEREEDTAPTSRRGEFLDPNGTRALHARGILVITVTAFDEASAAEALRAIALAEPWTRRSADLGVMWRGQGRR